MKTIRVTLPGVGARLAEAEAGNRELVEKYGVMTFRWSPGGDVDPIEMVLLDWERVGDDLRVVALASDDHAARLAVQSGGNVGWLEGD